MNRRNFIKEKYERVATQEKDGCTCNIYKPKTMQELPQIFIEEVLCDVHLFGVKDSKGWAFRNCDLGYIDAMLVYDFKKTEKDIYICSVLVRPFTASARDEYKKAFYYEGSITELIDNTIKTMWDSRIFEGNKKVENN